MGIHCLVNTTLQAGVMDGIDLAKQRFIKIPPAIPKNICPKMRFSKWFKPQEFGFHKKNLCMKEWMHMPEIWREPTERSRRLHTHTIHLVNTGMFRRTGKIAGGHMTLTKWK